MNVFNFQGKRALVTGGGRGIGRIIVHHLVRGGAQVLAVSRSEDDLPKLQAEFPPGKVDILALDLTDWNATEKALKPYADKIDLLVNNAGYARCVPFGQETEQSVDAHFNVNVKAAINVSQIVTKGMRERKSGAVVNISSVAGIFALADHLAYGASKAALDMVTKVMALELGQDKIRVNSVNPTVTNTEMAKAGWSDPVKKQTMMSKIPLHRFVEPEEVANVVCFLLSDAASMINGVVLPIDGGATGTSCPP